MDDGNAWLLLRGATAMTTLAAAAPPGAVLRLLLGRGLLFLLPSSPPDGGPVRKRGRVREGQAGLVAGPPGVLVGLV